MTLDRPVTSATVPGRSDPASVSANLVTYLAVLTRRKWVMLPALILVPLIVVGSTLRQDAVYEARAQVFLDRGDLAASLSGIVDPRAAQPDRLATTQAELARDPEVARRALAAVDVDDRGPDALLGATRIAPDPDADVLYFTVSDGDPQLAQRLATAYAEEFVVFRSELDSSAIERALERIRQRLDALRAAGGETSALYADLIAKRHQLETLDALQATTASLVRPASSATQTAPRPVARTAALGLGVGIALAIALAFLIEALDTRVTRVDEVEERLDPLPLLGQIPAPPPRLRERDVVMLRDPSSRYAESIRMLRVRSGLAKPEAPGRLVMVTSANAREGKTTTAANLAVALAQAGRSVVLCDLDARRPMVGTLFRLPGGPGLTDVVAGDVGLESALNVVPTGLKPYAARGRSADNDVRGGLEVLTLGRIPPEPGEFAGSDGVSKILARLRQRSDVVLVDTPALLAVGDAMTISEVVDALLVVVRLGLARRSTLRQLARVLGSSPAPALGFVVTGSSVGDRYDYAWYYGDPTSFEGEQEGEQEPLRQ